MQATNGKLPLSASMEIILTTKASSQMLAAGGVSTVSLQFVPLGQSELPLPSPPWPPPWPSRSRCADGGSAAAAGERRRRTTSATRGRKHKGGRQRHVRGRNSHKTGVTTIGTRIAGVPPGSVVHTSTFTLPPPPPTPFLPSPPQPHLDAAVC